MIAAKSDDSWQTYINEIEAFMPERAALEKAFPEKEARALLSAFERTTTWCGHMESAFPDNAASGILYAMHSKVLEIYVLVPLGLLHASYSTLRSILDMACSWTFFVSHPRELASVVAGRGGWLGRSKILEWHTTHTPGCEVLKGQIFQPWEKLYRELSAFVHCLPGSALPNRVRVRDWALEPGDFQSFLEVAREADEAVGALFLACFPDHVNHMARQDALGVTRGYKASILAQLSIAAL